MISPFLGSPRRIEADTPGFTDMWRVIEVQRFIFTFQNPSVTLGHRGKRVTYVFTCGHPSSRAKLCRYSRWDP